MREDNIQVLVLGYALLVLTWKQRWEIAINLYSNDNYKQHKFSRYIRKNV